MSSSFRRKLVKALKFALAIAIMACLVYRARDGFSQLLEKTIDWPLLFIGLVCTLTAAGLNFLRWHLLIRAQSIDITLPQTMSLGTLGLALNFVSPGAFGGDFFKAVFLAHGQPGKRTEAVATVVADRVVGLLTMLLIASIGILVSGLYAASLPSLRVFCQLILLFTVLTWTGVAALLVFPALSGAGMKRRAESIPLVGKTAGRLLGTIHVYRTQRKTLLMAFMISILMALSYVTSYYAVARGLPVHEPGWVEHLVIVPTAGLAGAIPLTPAGFGTTEAVVELLYQTMPGGDENRKDDGLIVAIGRRCTEIVVALIGFVYYLTHRRKVQAIYAEAEEAAEAEDRLRDLELRGSESV